VRQEATQKMLDPRENGLVLQVPHSKLHFMLSWTAVMPLVQAGDMP